MASTSEAAWNDLYNGVAELLGSERAETLMSHLLKDDHRLATESSVAELKKKLVELKSEVAGLKADVAGLQADVAGLKGDVGILKNDISGLNRNLVTGLILILATTIGILFAVL
ncbi:MAG TPA: hypothetical protein VE569_00275 [Acidimicrobiia bacterium]|nr:hypothetical protein [Acidimicrobiia bacterium]